MNETVFLAVDKYSTLIFRISFCHVKNKFDAEDVVQETFLSLLKAQPKIESEEHLKAWLIRVAINKCKNLHKATSRRKNVAFDEGLAASYNFDSNDIEMLDCLDRLKPLEKDILFLHYYEKYSAKEIGEIVGKKESAIFKKLQRTREKLKEFL